MPTRRLDLLAAPVCIVSVMIFVAGCDRAPQLAEQRRVPAGPLSVSEVKVREEGTSLTVQYHTPTPSADCAAQAAEMPGVWALVVRPRLSVSSVRRVVMFPEDASGQSVSFEFTKGGSGLWSAAAPCPIKISDIDEAAPNK